MSRRLRLEEKIVQQKDVDINVFERELEERVHGAIVWRTLASGIKIQDVKPKFYNDILQFLEDHYLDGDILCTNTNIKEDEDSKKSFFHKMLFILKDCTSIIAVEEEEVENESETDLPKKRKSLLEDEEEAVTKITKIVGVLLMKIINKSEYSRVFSRVQLVDGQAHRKIVEFTNHMSRLVDVYKELDCDSYMKYYVLCIHPDYRQKGIGSQLMRTGLDVARSLNVPVVMGIFSNYSVQRAAKRIGMKILYEVPYTTWLDENSEMVFCNPGAGNYTCAIMAGYVPPPPERVPTPPIEEAKPDEMVGSRASRRRAQEARKRKSVS